VKAMNKEETIAREDHDLLLLSIQDPAVFSAIVERYQEAFLRKAVTIIGNEEDARDIVQDAFVKIYLNAAKFEKRESSAFSSWAYKILLNTCFTHYRRCKRGGGLVSLDETILAEEAKGIEEETNMDKFLLVLSKIPAKFSKLLRLLVVDGKSAKDVALSEGISEGAARVRIHRAKESFKKALVQNTNL
jgi:RNA polymerase sigma-70 factor (ECF subfamily)